MGSMGPSGTWTSPIERGRTFDLNKGQLNKLRLRPLLINEHVESSREVQATVSSSLIVGQIFRLPQPNIGAVALTVEPDPTFTAIDDFESYANSAALQVEWVEVGGAAVAELEETIVGGDSSTKSMKLTLSKAGGSWTNTIGSTNLEGKQFSLEYYQNVSPIDAILAFRVGDGTNTKSINLIVGAANTWKTFSFLESDMSDDGSTTPDMTAITKITFAIIKKKGGAIGYIDNLKHASGTANVDLKLYEVGHYGSTPEASSAINSWTQYTKLGDLGITGIQASSVRVPLLPGKRLYNVTDFVAGVAEEMSANEILKKGNYYAFTINCVDVDVKIYGPLTSENINYYNNGYAFSAPDISTTITKLGTYSDLSFVLFSTGRACVHELHFHLLPESSYPGAQASLDVFFEDENMKIVEVPHIGSVEKDEVLDLSENPKEAKNGWKIECYYDDDGSDDVTQAYFSIRYCAKKDPTYG